MPSTADAHASPSSTRGVGAGGGDRGRAVHPGLAEPVEAASRGGADRLGRRAALGGFERVGRLGERERAEGLRGRDRALRATGQAAAQDRQRVRPVLAGEPPERVLELARAGIVARAASTASSAGSPPDQGVQGRRYHWVRSRSTGWSAGGESAGQQ